VAPAAGLDRSGGRCGLSDYAPVDRRRPRLADTPTTSWREAAAGDGLAALVDGPRAPQGSHPLRPRRRPSHVADVGASISRSTSPLRTDGRLLFALGRRRPPCCVLSGSGPRLMCLFGVALSTSQRAALLLLAISARERRFFFNIALFSAISELGLVCS
jgi:hypothetical protein